MERRPQRGAPLGFSLGIRTEPAGRSFLIAVAEPRFEHAGRVVDRAQRHPHPYMFLLRFHFDVKSAAGLPDLYVVSTASDFDELGIRQFP